MFYRGEEIVSNTNQIIDDKNLILNDFNNLNSLKDHKNTSNSSNSLLINQFSSSSSSSTTSSSSSSTNSTTSKSIKYSNASSLSNQEQTQSIKRKSTESHQSSNQKIFYLNKPVYSEILSSKCILYIYYKGEMSNVIDEHFKKSLSINASKSSATLSPLSLSSTSSSPNIKPASSKTIKSPSILNNNNKTETNDKDPSFWSKNTITQTTNDPWTCYHSLSNQTNSQGQYANTTLNNNIYDSCWNRSAVEMASFYSNQHYHYSNSLSKIPSSSSTNNNQYVSNNQYLNESISFDPHSGYLNNSNVINNTKTNTKINIKEEPQINLLNNSFETSNGSFLSAAAAAAAAAAVINPYSFQTQSNPQYQQDLTQYSLTASGLSSSSSSLSSLSSTVNNQCLTSAQADNFQEYSNSALQSNPNAVSAAAKVAAVAAAAANQYLSASINAVVNGNGNNSSNYHHGKYSQYFDIGKQPGQIDCRRSSNSLNSTYPHYGFDFNNTSNELSNSHASATTNSSTSTSQAYASPIWY